MEVNVPEINFGRQFDIHEAVKQRRQCLRLILGEGLESAIVVPYLVLGSIAARVGMQSLYTCLG